MSSSLLEILALMDRVIAEDLAPQGVGENEFQSLFRTPPDPSSEEQQAAKNLIKALRGNTEDTNKLSPEDFDVLNRTLTNDGNFDDDTRLQTTAIKNFLEKSRSIDPQIITKLNTFPKFFKDEIGYNELVSNLKAPHNDASSRS